MYGQPEPCVVIAGDGVAASALACRLLDHNFGVVILGRRRPSAVPTAVTEALPEATVRLFAEIGLGPQLEGAGAAAVDGFDNLYGADPRRLAGIWVHVDRSRLARACLTEARRRGATLVPSTGSRPRALPGAFAAVDATGRAARWSRPVARWGSGVATLYRGDGRSSARPGRVVRTEHGWAYRLDHPDATTVGVVAGSQPDRTLSGDLAARLGLDDPGDFVRVGIQPAFVQWSHRVVTPGRLAVGDAALAYNPLAGQGLRFALSSALAAAAVVTSWQDGDERLASDYYQSFVDGARRRHLAKLRALEGGREGEDAPTVLDLSRQLRFVAKVGSVGVNVGGRIARDDCCVLADGGLVRWVGGFDLLRVREAVGEGTTVDEACRALAVAGIPERTAHGLLAWALQAGAVESVRLDPELSGVLRERAEREGWTNSELIRDALRSYLEES